MTCAIAFCGGLRRLFSFYYLELRAPDRGVSAWKVRAGWSVSSPWPEKKRGVISAPFSSASGLVTAVDKTMLVSSSRRPAPVKGLSLPWAPCFAH